MITHLNSIDSFDSSNYLNTNDNTQIQNDKGRWLETYYDE